MRTGDGVSFLLAAALLCGVVCCAWVGGARHARFGPTDPTVRTLLLAVMALCGGLLLQVALLAPQ